MSNGQSMRLEVVPSMSFRYCNPIVCTMASAKSLIAAGVLAMPCVDALMVPDSTQGVSVLRGTAPVSAQSESKFCAYSAFAYSHLGHKSCLVHCLDPAEEDISFKKYSQRDVKFSAQGPGVIQLFN